MIDSKKKFKNNLLYAFTAQFISLLLSVIMSVVVPKFLNVENFGFWQLFLFYVSYAGFFHFGLTDGIYLTLGGKRIEELDKREINNQFHILLYIQIIVSLIVLILSMTIVHGEKSYILLISSIYILVANLNWFLGYVFQAVNETKTYSISVMIDRALFILFVIGTFIFRLNSFYLLIILYTFTRLVALIYCIWKARGLLSIKSQKITKSFINTINYIKIGINITLSSIASMLIVGVGRFFVEHRWGIKAFGKFSLSISITNFFLAFIQQISMVLFPALRQVKDLEKTKKIYINCRKALCIMLPILFIGYIPCKIALSWWLPQYKISLKYLSLLLPLCIFDGKMQMLSNTYMKVLRKEKKLLKFNLIALLIALVTSIIGTYIIENVYFIILGLLLSIIIRSVVSELYLAKEMNIVLDKEYKYITMEILFSIIFIVSNFFLNSILAFAINVVCYILYCVILKECFLYTKELIFNKIVKKA